MPDVQTNQMSAPFLVWHTPAELRSKADASKWSREFPTKAERWYGDVAALAFPLPNASLTNVRADDRLSSSGLIGPVRMVVVKQ